MVGLAVGSPVLLLLHTLELNNNWVGVVIISFMIEAGDIPERTPLPTVPKVGTYLAYIDTSSVSTPISQFG
jgi:hypothetical protein